MSYPLSLNAVRRTTAVVGLAVLCAKAAALRKMVEYGITDGQKIADSMGYIPLPANVVEQVRSAAQFIK